MPSEDYSTASRGALKIKGVQGSRIDKSKKKKKAKHAEGGGNSADQKSDIAQGKQKSLADALADEDEKDKELSSPGSNMTEAERQSYERRYKMVCLFRNAQESLLIPTAGGKAQEGGHQVSQGTSREPESISKLTQ